MLLAVAVRCSGLFGVRLGPHPDADESSDIPGDEFRPLPGYQQRSLIAVHEVLPGSQERAPVRKEGAISVGDEQHGHLRRLDLPKKSGRSV
jgi:hypothetical protein